MLETDPARGEDIDKNGTVDLILSKGPERYAVPNVVGRTEEVARPMIEDSNLTVATPKRKYSSKVEQGQGHLERPARPARSSSATASCKLVISNGPQPVAVPNVVGMPVDQAKVAVTEAKLQPEVTEKFHETVPAGVVISQSPERGTADKDSVVELVVSKGPPLVEVPASWAPTSPMPRTPWPRSGSCASVQQLPAGPGTVLQPVTRRRRQDPQGLDGHALRVLAHSW